MKFAPIPRPGSDEAIKQSCTCQIIHNAIGKHAPLISNDCPIHGQPSFPDDIMDD